MYIHDGPILINPNFQQVKGVHSKPIRGMSFYILYKN
jgi:hypothetical protein